MLLCTFSALPPVVPDTVALRVDMWPVTEASRVDKRIWPGVIAKLVESEVISTACEDSVNQCGSILPGGAEVGENANVPDAAVLDDSVPMLSYCEVES